MILPWLKKRGGRGHRKTASATTESATELTIPIHFRCPISLELMKDPVTLSTGITYDRDSIEAWIFDQGHATCPFTNQPLPRLDPVPNHNIRRMIQDWCVEKRSLGVERIPTPKIPLSSSEASELLTKLESSSTPEIANGLATKLVAKARESDRNRRVILECGGARVIAAKFDALSVSDENGVVLEELLACLALLDGVQIQLGSSESLKRIVSILKSDDLASRRNAVTVLKGLTDTRASALAETEGVIEALVNAVKEPISGGLLKDSLLIIYHIIKARPESVSECLELGLLQEVVEIAISSERGLCEKALGVIDELCGDEVGREAARGHATTVPVVVKKMLRVSDLATEFAVSILWKLSAGEGGEGVLKEALEVGAFQKVLVVLQVGCVKEGRKVTEVLKRLNGVQRLMGRVECVESMDFKALKRSF